MAKKPLLTSASPVAQKGLVRVIPAKVQQKQLASTSSSKFLKVSNHVSNPASNTATPLLKTPQVVQSDLTVAVNSAVAAKPWSKA